MQLLVRESLSLLVTEGARQAVWAHCNVSAPLVASVALILTGTPRLMLPVLEWLLAVFALEQLAVGIDWHQYLALMY